MLSGIRTGKKKKRKATDEPAESFDDVVVSAAAAASPPPPAAAKRPPSDNNVSIAEQLRRQLASGNVPVLSSSTKKQQEALPFDRLQQQGRIGTAAPQANPDDNVVVLTAAASTSSHPDFRREDFRHGSRKGKMKRAYVDAAGTSREHAEMSVHDMVQEERQHQETMDEVYARNVARVGSRYKGTELKQASATGADEDDHVDMTMYQHQNLTKVASQNKERSRQLAQHDKQQSLTSRCWWWMESSSFRKHMLIALGNHIALVMAPAHLSLLPGDHLYLVPIQHADALVACEDDAWNEIQRFQQSLRDMYAKESKGIVFSETVLPSSKGLWQTRMECIAVPTKRDAENADMYFKTALTDHAEEWGTHTKLMSTRDKGLRRTIPKKFPYFYVEWELNRGYAQIIESSSFPKDLAQDTLAGMLGMDPIRFRRKQKQSPDEERKIVLDFVAKFKPFDWTVGLD